MSAVRDQSQNTKFVFSNFYHLYLQGKLAARSQEPLAKGLVLKTQNLDSLPEMAQIRVVSAKQSEEAKNFAMASQSRKDLSQSLKSIREARKRLVFLMQEVDDILKRG